MTSFEGRIEKKYVFIFLVLFSFQFFLKLCFICLFLLFAYLLILLVYFLIALNGLY